MEDGPGSLRTVFLLFNKRKDNTIMKLKALFVAVAAMIGMVFCASLDAQQVNPDKVGTPAHTVKTFFRSMAQADFATAKNCVSSQDLTSMVTMMEQMTNNSPETAAKMKKQFAKVFKALKIKSEKINGDTAEVVIACVDPITQKTEDETVKLKKVNGAWKIVK